MVRSDGPDFAALDALLDQALELEGEARTSFVESLPPEEREALTALLRQSGSDALARLAGAVDSALPTIAGDDADTAGGWRLIREIGSGGMGQVFYAERRVTGPSMHPDGTAGADSAGDYLQRAAVKLLWAHRVTPQFKSRFYRERRILASIDHPGLARFLDGGLMDDGRPWFAMEYVDGKDAVSWCEDRPIAARLEIFVRICETVQYAHQRLIVHRDLKPQNVLVDENDQPRLLDFGVARLIDDSDEERLTRTQGTPLTLLYASPEQVRAQPVDVASDVYQLGLLLYEMLTGRPAHDLADKSLEQSIASICETEPVPPSARVPEVHRDLDAVIGRALDKTPSRRYASAAALSEDVRRYLAGRPVTARPQSLGYVAWRFVQRNAALVGISAVSVLALAGATVFSMQMAREAREEAERSRVTQSILADLFRQADPFGDGGADVTLAEALVKSKPAIDARIAGDPRLAWEVNRTLADIYASLDLLELELEAVEAAAAAAERLDGDNETERLFAIAGKANILARTDPREAVAYVEAELPPEPSSEAAAVNWLSAKYAEVSAWIRLRDDDRADAGARRMAEVAEAFDVQAPRTLGRINQLLAGVARRAGDLPAADAHWQLAVDYLRQANQPAGYAVTLSNMALHYGMTGRYEASEAAFLEALEVFREAAPDAVQRANILRLYAGLLFRMGRPDESLAALDEALVILAAQEEGYAYFVAQDNYAQFSLVTGDADGTLDAIEGGLEVAVPAYGPDGDVTRRMLPTFARLLVFGGRDETAGRLLRLEEAVLCGDAAARVDAVIAEAEVIADVPDLAASRKTIAAAIAAADPGSGGVTEAVTGYREHQHTFLDALDHWQYLRALERLAEQAGEPLPADLAARLADVEARRVAAVRLLGETRAEDVDALVRALQPGDASSFATACGSGSAAAGSSAAEAR
jgi:serine/threonine-protein kinase